MKASSGPDATFREALAKNEFLLPQGDDCGKFHFFPRVMCPHCHGAAITWKPASGKGRVYTTTVVRQKAERGGDYNVCVVELAEGVRMMSRIEGIEPGDVTIDMAVRAIIGDAEGQPAILFQPDEG